jgi:hypothetical protein
MPAASGPANWPRATGLDDPLPRTPVTPAVIDDIKATDDSISFTVDEESIGSPVLVKASYFPNWQAKGASGPYRVMPNLMVVVPTSTKVELHYGDTPVDYLAWGLTLLGLVALVIIAVRPALRLAPTGRGAPGETDADGGGPPRDPTGDDPFAAWPTGLGGPGSGAGPPLPLEEDFPPPSSKDWMAAERDPSLGWLWAVPDRPLSAADGVFGLDGADGADGTDTNLQLPRAGQPAAPAFDPAAIPQAVHWTDRDEVPGDEA